LYQLEKKGHKVLIQLGEKDWNMHELEVKEELSVAEWEKKFEPYLLLEQ
jgi:hypothetical protein